MDITGVRAERPPARDIRRDLWGGLAVAVLGGVQVGHALEPAVAAAAGGRLRAWVPVLLGLALVAAAVAQVAGAVRRLSRRGPPRARANEALQPPRR